MAKKILNNLETYGVIRNKINDNFTDLYDNKSNKDHSHTELHTHDNKNVLDSISQNDIIKWNSGSGGGGTAEDITYDNAESGLVAEDVQGAIDEVTSQLASTAKKSEVQDMIGNLSNATPLFANNISEMTDTSRLYVNLADGYLYSNDGTEWVSTGVLYQSTGIAEKSIKCEHLSNDVIKKIKSIETLYEDPVDLWEGRIWITVPSRIAIDTLDQPDPIFIYSIYSAQSRKIGISYIPEKDFRLLTAEFGLTSRIAQYHDTGNDIQVSLVTASEIDGLPLFEDPIAIKHITNCPDTPDTPFIGYIDFKEDGINLIAGIRYYFVLEVLEPSTGNSSYSNLGLLDGSTTNSIAARYYNGAKWLEPYNGGKWLGIEEAYDSNIRICGARDVVVV